MFQVLRPLEGEEQIRRDQGLFEQMVSWKPGFLYLTTRRLIFAQGEKIVFQGYLEELKDVEVVKRRCILSKMVKQLKIVSDGRVNYVAIRKADNWLDEIRQAFFEDDLHEDGK